MVISTIIEWSVRCVVLEDAFRLHAVSSARIRICPSNDRIFSWSIDTVLWDAVPITQPTQDLGVAQIRHHYFND